MKKKNFIFVASLLGLSALASCNNSKEKLTEITKEAATSKISAFASSVSGSVSLTYTANYQVDVNANGGTGNMDSFKHDIQDTTTADIDFTSGNLYLKVKKTAVDALVSTSATTTEALVYKDGSSYYYLTSTMENPVALADEATALAKIDELLQRVSYNLGGFISTDTLLYTGNNAYQYREFGLSSTSITQEYWYDPYYYGTDSNDNLVIRSYAEYVGYHTDSGISDFSSKKDYEDGGHAAEIEVRANTKGYVTSWVENYTDASLDFAIMTPAPTVTISGSRSFAATYGETLSKVTTIEHAKTMSTVSWTESNYGDFAVYTCDPADLDTKVSVSSDDQVQVGHLLAVAVAPAGENKVKAVTYGDKSATIADDGYYYFEILDGDNTLSVSFTGSDTNANAKWATVTSVNYGTGVESVTVTWFDYASGSTDTYPLDSLNRAPIGATYFLVIDAVYADGYEMDTITVNGNAAANYGAWCYNIKDEGNYAVEVTAKATGGSEVPTTEAVFTVTADDGVSSYSVWTLDNFDYAGMADVTALGKVTAQEGRYLCLKVELVEGESIVSVTVNGNDASLYGGFYCVTATTAGTYDYVVTTTAANTTDAAFTVTADAGVSSYSVWTLDNFDYAGMADVTALGKVTAQEGRFLCLKVEVAEGESIVSVTVNGNDASLYGGFYCVAATTAGTYDYVVTTTAASATDVVFTVTTDAGVSSYSVWTLDNFDYAGMADVTALGKVAAQEGRFLCLKVEVAEGYTISSVKVGDKDASLYSGFYCVAATAAGTYTFVVTTTTA